MGVFFVWDCTEWSCNRIENDNWTLLLQKRVRWRRNWCVRTLEAMTKARSSRPRPLTRRFLTGLARAHKIKSTIAAKGACTRYHLGCNDASHYHFINCRLTNIREHILAWRDRSQLCGRFCLVQGSTHVLTKTHYSFSEKKGQLVVDYCLILIV